MEKLIICSNWLLFLLFLALPLITFRILELTRNKRTKNLMIIGGLILVITLPFIAAWWSDKSTEILLKHYNALTYSTDFETYIFSLKNVMPENINRVQKLESSYFGIGWPLKAITTLIFYIPAISAIYFIQLIGVNFIKKSKIFTKNKP